MATTRQDMDPYWQPATASAAGTVSFNAIAADLATRGLVPVEIYTHTCGVGETSMVIPCDGALYSQLRIECDVPGGISGANIKMVADAAEGGCMYESATHVDTFTAARSDLAAILVIWPYVYTVECNLRRSVITGKAWIYHSQGHNLVQWVGGSRGSIDGWLPQWSSALTINCDGGAAFPTGTKLTLTGILIP